MINNRKKILKLIRPISIAQLSVSLHLHLQPINHVVFMGTY
jgi:hypothetical protein